MVWFIVSETRGCYALFSIAMLVSKSSVVSVPVPHSLRLNTATPHIILRHLDLRRPRRRRCVIANTSKHKMYSWRGQQVIMMMRAWAVWGRSRVIAALLTVLFLVSVLILSSSIYNLKK